jgi:hypothetical protein
MKLGTSEIVPVAVPAGSGFGSSANNRGELRLQKSATPARNARDQLTAEYNFLIGRFFKVISLQVLACAGALTNLHSAYQDGLT